MSDMKCFYISIRPSPQLSTAVNWLIFRGRAFALWSIHSNLLSAIREPLKNSQLFIWLFMKRLLTGMISFIESLEEVKLTMFTSVLLNIFSYVSVTKYIRFEVFNMQVMEDSSHSCGYFTWDCPVQSKLGSDFTKYTIIVRIIFK